MRIGFGIREDLNAVVELPDGERGASVRTPKGPGSGDVVNWDSIQQSFAGDRGRASCGAVLLGNGFSTNIWSDFGYHTLLEESGLDGIARDLFGARTNFETTLAELTTARRVLLVAAPGASDLAEQLENLVSQVRDALLNAVGAVHPAHSQLLAGKKEKAGIFSGVPEFVLPDLTRHLRRYSQVFVTNYDLIAYWVAVNGGIGDFFHGAYPFNGQQAEDWLAWPMPKIFFLHGALHLWRSLSTNAEGKYKAEQQTPLTEVVRASLDTEDRLPLFISEGSSKEKMARISGSPYLSFCLNALGEADVPLTVLGHSLSDVDQHICEAIERHPDRKVAIGIWVGDTPPEKQADELKTEATKIRGRLPHCTDLVFFNSSEHPLTRPGLACK